MSYIPALPACRLLIPDRCMAQELATGGQRRSVAFQMPALAAFQLLFQESCMVQKLASWDQRWTIHPTTEEWNCQPFNW